jgi:hypothetical protein
MQQSTNMERFALLGNGRRNMRLRFRLPGNLVDKLRLARQGLQVFFRFIFCDIGEAQYFPIILNSRFEYLGWTVC